MCGDATVSISLKHQIELMSNDSDENEQRIIDLEIKLTMLEQAHEQMSQVMIEQQESIEALTRELERAKQHVAALGDMIEEDSAPPPHY